MNEKQGAVPVQPIQAPMPKAPEKPKIKSNLTILWVALGMFAAGVIGGILLFVTYPFAENKTKTTTPAAIPSPTPFMLPNGAVKIAECKEGMGEQYEKLKDDFPRPIYMLYKNEVIGLRFVVDQKKIIDGEIINKIKKLNLNIDHIKTGVLAVGATESANYLTFFDLFLVDYRTKASIICEKTAEPLEEASISADISVKSEETPTPEISETEITPPDDESSARILVSPGE